MSLRAQILTPVKWSYAAKKITATEAVVFIKATIDDGWHIYSVNQKPGGPLKTSFKFVASPDYVLSGKVTEPKPIKKYEDGFMMDVFYFEKTVIFQQKIRLKKGQATVDGKVEFMVCNNKQCLPGDTAAFSIPIK
jgi:DsbC/DsbD-like thiol-disulfide interchange protein